VHVGTCIGQLVADVQG